ncbi:MULTISPECIES: PucR family transcriptional regulator [Streptomyces]|uniref:PucR family transcriptional regulator n=2 Tax=Streptomyces rimosus subsp. rimosus TaxID=132474 RepID=L8EHC7_STRR1|nr:MULTISPECIES: PucR family transcriptional regulator [Streptomyces]KOG74642.1 CdaR family transcriptional regulator [Kitasatospora aureofaciens]MYT41533.1 PucR family transcriptional regulator [Streptomyces sp. SID5471]KEF03457.1 CdaR family transcriptional regulator [Streptomyces rimosus]KEF17159.1 CdaR family transcriptional regulator [Streptomyces rimosus]KOT27127.1 CdaR family transcriptional regulator [Streptomyces rimosus subsp. rimosus]
MPLRIADLLARPELNLSLTYDVPAGQLDRTVEAATVSDLLHPGKWLQGGELLMTIGLVLPMEPAACRTYVQDVTEGGAACLALGLGRGLPYQKAPAPLVDAAREAGLPLLTVPDEVPFIAVTKAVFDARADEQRAVLQRAFATQRRLTAAATDSGLQPMLEEWTAATGVGATVLDPLGRLLATGGGQSAPPPAARDLVERVAARGLRGSASSTAGGRQLEVQPLGARRLRGLLLLVGSPDAAARAVVPGLVSLLSLELERRHLMDEPERRRRSALLAELLSDEEGPAGRAHGILAAAGLHDDRVRGVVIEPPAAGPADSGPHDIAADLALAVPGGLVRVAESGLIEAVVGAGLDVRDVLGRFAPHCPAGIGPLAPPDTVRVSLRQAAGLLGVSRASGVPEEARQSAASRLLLDLGDRRTLHGYADAVLGPLDLADHGEELLTTLAAWLETGGAWDATSRRLGVHRHTVRNRLDKAMDLTGRRLDDPDDRFDLWLATRIRSGGDLRAGGPGRS